MNVIVLFKFFRLFIFLYACILFFWMSQNAVSKSGHLIEMKRRRTFETNKEKEISKFMTFS